MLTAISFQVVITAAFLPEAEGGAAATGVAPTRHSVNASAVAVPRNEWWAAEDVELGAWVSSDWACGRLGYTRIYLI